MTKQHDHTTAASYVRKHTDRRQAQGEVFTPGWLVEQIIDTYPRLLDPNTTVFEPGFGDGAFIVGIVAARITAGIDPIEAV